MMSLDKSLIRQRFEKSIPTYTKEAIVQYAMNMQLVSIIHQKFPLHFNKVMELGCGTFTLTHQLLNQASIKEYFLNDLYKDEQSWKEAIQKYKQTDWEFLHGDAECISFPNQLDMVLSGSTFQWFGDLEKMLSKIHQALKQDGIMAFSTFGPQNLKEIRSITQNGLDYLHFDKVKALIGEKYKIIHTSEGLETLHFKSPKEILYHLKKTGVNGVNNQKWNKSDFIHFSQSYEQFKDAQGYRLTYHPMIFVGVRD